MDSKTKVNFDIEQAAKGGITSASLKKDLKKLTKGSLPLQKPLSAVKQQRLERTINYDKNKKEAAKWIPQIKLNRDANCVDYTIEENRTKGATIASMAAEFEPKDQTEKLIEEALAKDGLATDNQIMEKEKADLWQLEPEEMHARIKQMAKLKFLLFRQEIKNKRIKKIKSKLYHKIKRKAREKEEQKLIKELEEVDPEAAKEYHEKIEQKRLEERMSMRHGSHSKFAKNLKRYGTFSNDQNKQAYFDLVRQHNDLMKKTKQVTNLQSDSDSGSDESSGEENADLTKLKADALAKINQQISDSEDSEAEGEEDDGFDEAKVEREKLKKQAKKLNKPTGIMGLKFMQKAEKAQKEIMKEKSKMLIDEINHYENESEESEDESDAQQEQSDDEELDEIQLEGSEQESDTEIYNIKSQLKSKKEEALTPKSKKDGAKMKFAGEVQNTSISGGLTLQTDDVRDLTAKLNKKNAAVKAQNKAESKDHIDRVLESSNVLTSEDLVKQWQGSTNKISGKKRGNNELTFDPKTDLKDFKIDDIKNNRKRIKIDEIDEFGKSLAI